MGFLVERKPPEVWILVGVLLLACMADRAISQTRSREELLKNLGISGSGGGRLDCEVTIEGLQDWRAEGVTNPDIKALVVCDEKVVYNKTEKLFDLKPFDFQDVNDKWKGIQLFADFKGRGKAYVMLDDPPRIEFMNSKFENLPPFPDGSLAPVVAHETRLTIDRTLFKNNGGGYELTGALYVTKGSEVLMLSSEIHHCEGKNAGAIEVDSGGDMDAEESIFNGTMGETVAGVIHAHGKSKIEVENCGFVGIEPPQDFIKFAKGELEMMPNVTVPFAGAIACKDECIATIDNTVFNGFFGRSGTLHSTHNAILAIEKLKFIENYAEFGGGLFIEGDTANFAKVTDCLFEKNVARMGGGVVAVGKGGVALRGVDMLENKALVGGGLFSDFVLPGKKETVTCGKASEGSEIDITNSTIIGNTATENGGGIHTKCTKVAIKNCDVIDNSSGLFGGGIFLDTGVELDAEDSRFISNKARSGGAAMFALKTTTVDAENCTINKNSVWGRDGGGALGAQDSDHIILTNTEVVGNTAGGPGGGVWLKNTKTLLIDGIKFAGNSADGRGGALYADGVEDTFDMENSIVADNIAGKGGGGLALHNVGTSFIATSSFQNNTAAGDGGAIDLAAPSLPSNSKSNSILTYDLTLFDVPFERNTAGLSCGAIRADGFEKVEFTDTAIQQNEAGSNGGGACIERFKNFTLGNSTTINSNKAGQKGGGIHLRKSTGLVALTSTAIEGNEADEGVAINAEECNDIYVEGIPFASNSAGSACGAIRLAGAGKVDFVGLEFSKNSAGATNGGAVCLEGIEDFTSHNGTSFESNEAKQSGGAIYVKDCVKLSFDATPFEGNRAGGSGGAIGGSGVDDFTADGAEFLNNQCLAYGGGVGIADIRNAILDEVKFTNNSGGTNGGAFWISGGKKFVINDTVFHQNGAGGNGGAFVAEDFKVGEIIGALLTRNQAGGNGGGLVTDKVGNLRVISTRIEGNNARKQAGALQLLSTNMVSSELILKENEADESGGALLCESDSEIHISKANFTHNFARAGQSLTALCGCSVNVTQSVFMRERSRSKNGDFFHTARKCGAVIHTLECEFFGSPLKKLAKWVLVVIVLGAVLLFLAAVMWVACCCFTKSARKKAEALKDMEEGFPPSPILAPGAYAGGQAGRAKSTTSDDDDNLDGYNTSDLASTDASSFYSSESDERPNGNHAPHHQHQH